jgi:hypothetical protein
MSAGEQHLRESDSHYPEHEKLAKVSDESQAIGEFLDLGRWTLCELRQFEERRDPQLVAVDIQAALAEYFGIDRAALEREKRAMLDALRASA